MTGSAFDRTTPTPTENTHDVPRAGPRISSRGNGSTMHVRVAERRRSRTYQPWGYHGLPVLKTGWATGPVPLQGRRILRGRLCARVRRARRRRPRPRTPAWRPSPSRAAASGSRRSAPELVGGLVGLRGGGGNGISSVSSSSVVLDGLGLVDGRWRRRRWRRRRRVGVSGPELADGPAGHSLAQAGVCLGRRDQHRRSTGSARNEPQEPLHRPDLPCLRPEPHRPNYTRPNRAASCSEPDAALLIAAPRAARGCPVHRR